MNETRDTPNVMDKLPAQAKKSEVAVQHPRFSDPRLASSSLLGGSTKDFGASWLSLGASALASTNSLNELITLISGQQLDSEYFAI